MTSIMMWFCKCHIFAPMFKKITASLLLLAFVSQTFAGPFVMLDYYLNTAAYVKNCINKARPKMHCNGKCQAMKKMQEEEKKEQQNAERKAELKIPVLSSKSFFCQVQPLIIKTAKATTFEKQYPLTDISYSFFHPPQA
ncbi:MAG: hypothetical protein JNM14_05135 [Ferruginibacter sp.]|nr:hypothetical protein [Ferruginibacter sp.]